MSATVITALLASVSTVIVGLLAYLGTRSQLRAGRDGAAATAEEAAADRALRAWESLLEPMQAEMGKLREEIAAERREVAAMRRTLQRVVTQIRPIVHWLDAGAAPPPPVVHAELRQVIDKEVD